jgi:hypothetical protein
MYNIKSKLTNHIDFILKSLSKTIFFDKNSCYLFKVYLYI